MVQHVTSLLCSKVISDERTRFPSFIEVLNGASFSLTALPSPVPPLTLVSTWFSNSNKPISANFRIGVIAPGEKKHIMLEQQLKIGGDNGRIANIYIEIVKLVVKHEGEHVITIETKVDKK